MNSQINTERSRFSGNRRNLELYPLFIRIRKMFSLEDEFYIDDRMSDDELLLSFGLEAERILTTGPYSKAPIYVAKYKNRDVAIKTVNLNQGRFIKHAKTELEVVKQISHPNIVTHFAYFRAGTRIFNIMEYVPDGTLGKYIKMNIDKTSYLDKIFYDVLQAIKYLHTKLIVHRDIKDENIVLKFNEGCAPTPKLCDFGFSMQLRHPYELLSSYCGTKSFKAPELLHAEEPYDPFKAEIWALGILFHKMYTRKTPVYNMETRKMNVDMTFFPKKVIDVLTITLRVEPTERPDVHTLLNLKIFREYDKNVCLRN